MNTAALAAWALLIFIAGFGWGRSSAEKQIRTEQSELNRGRINVSMPADRKEAAEMLGLLKTLMHQASRKTNPPGNE